MCKHDVDVRIITQMEDLLPIIPCHGICGLVLFESIKENICEAKLTVDRE